ncbi:unnamed protein product [Linum trigynum]|uniref:Uncharacterized protein n=1 Tax=Linum trigynum TaxID=586398 RepID=A0AAV2EXY4_9ROSI
MTRQRDTVATNFLAASQIGRPKKNLEYTWATTAPEDINSRNGDDNNDSDSSEPEGGFSFLPSPGSFHLGSFFSRPFVGCHSRSDPNSPFLHQKQTQSFKKNDRRLTKLLVCRFSFEVREKQNREERWSLDSPFFPSLLLSMEIDLPRRK